MFREDISELRALVWDIAARVDKLKRISGAEESQRLLGQVSESLKEAHLGLYFVQVEVGIPPKSADEQEALLPPVCKGYRMIVHNTDGVPFIFGTEREFVTDVVTEDVIPLLNRHPEWHIRIKLPMSSFYGKIGRT